MIFLIFLSCDKIEFDSYKPFRNIHRIYIQLKYNMSDSDDDFKPPPPSFPDSTENPPIVDGDNDSVVDSDSDDDYVPPPPQDDDDDDDDDNDSLAGSDTDIDPYNTKQSDNTDTFAENSPYVDLSDDDISDGDDDDDEPDENYLQKFDDSLKANTISSFHPELLHHNNEEVEALSRVVRNEQGIISDPLHLTIPFITKYERARIIGERAKQLGMGAKPLVEVGADVIDAYLIALSEYEQKRIPFIIKRPLPNGGCEYWKFKDLESV